MVEYIPVNIGEPSSQPVSSLGSASGDRHPLRRHWADSVTDSSECDDPTVVARAGDSAGKPERTSDFRQILDGKMQQADPESAQTDGGDQTPRTEKQDKTTKGTMAVEAAIATLETGHAPASELAGRLASKAAKPTTSIPAVHRRSVSSSRPKETRETAKAFVPPLKTGKSDGSPIGQTAKPAVPIETSGKNPATKSEQSGGKDIEIGRPSSIVEERPAKPATPETPRTERSGDTKATTAEPAASQTRHHAAHEVAAAAVRSAASSTRAAEPNAETGPVRIAAVPADPGIHPVRVAKDTGERAKIEHVGRRGTLEKVRKGSTDKMPSADGPRDSKETTLPKVKIAFETQEATQTQNREGSSDITAQAASATAEPAARSATHRAVGENSVTPGPTSAAGEAARSMTGPRPHEQITQQLMDTPPTPGREIRITLNPPELGRVQIRFTETDGQVHGHLQAENAQTRQQIERHVPEILAALQNQGLQVRRIDVTPEQPPVQHQSQASRDNADQGLSQFHDAHADAERSAHQGHNAHHSAQPSSAWVEPAANQGVGVQQYAEDRVNLYI